MILVIGVMDLRMKEFLKNNVFDDHVKVIYKMCDVKLIKEKTKVVIPFGFVQDSGLINNTYVHFYELLLMLNVTEVIYYNSYNESKLKSICDEFNVRYLKL